jgi:hypothetical protein
LAHSQDILIGGFVAPAVKYTLGRIGLFLAVALALWPIDLNIFLKLMLAVIFSAALSFFLLRGWRDEMAQRLAEAAQRRRAEKERLRSALAGEDRPPAPASPEPPAASHDGDGEGQQR